MTPIILYIIKVNVALAVLYCFYKLLFTKDTFFGLRRLMLILIYVVAFACPLFHISGWLNGYNTNGEAINTFLYEKILPEITVFSGIPYETQSYSWFTIIIACIYLTGVITLLMRTLVEIRKNCITLYQSKKTIINGVEICLINNQQEPYSFFRWICLNPDMHNEKEINKILLHEQTHVYQLHSVDILLAQIAIIFNWFNPFAWLIRSEMRINHEYIADKKVVNSGHDKKEYQYLLLGIQQTSPAAATLYNNFSVLPLKKRIKMLNKRRTRNIMKQKYLMFIPVVALLVFLSNCVNMTEQKPVNDNKEEVQNTATEKVANKSATNVNKTDSVYSVVEQMPSFKGGEQALMSYLSKNVQYPDSAIQKNIQGRVVTKFIVDQEGNISNIEIVQSVDPLLDREAIRVLRSMPKWTPGKQDGKNVSVTYTVPISFKLQ